MARADRGKRWHLGRAWVGLGVAGSLLMTVAAPRLVDPGTTTWWFVVRIPPGRAGNMIAFYVGLVALAAAWLGLGRRLARASSTSVERGSGTSSASGSVTGPATGSGARPVELGLVAVLWGLPLAVGPAIFSGDMFSYLAQGEILRLGLDPYRAVPLALGHLGHQHLLDAVSPFWRTTTAPYGPLFLGLVSVIVGVTGSHLVAGILAVRSLEIAGVVLIAVFVPRLARSFGADPLRAMWLAVASPLVLLQLVSAGHNDALMCGCMLAGVTLARERRPLLGIALCALAATIKVPAGAAVLFIAVPWVRGLESRRARIRFAVGAIAVTGAVIAAVSAATGLGLGWISTTLLSTPGKVHLAITPVTALGWTVARALDGLGAAVGAHSLESAFGDVALAATAVLAIVLLWRARLDDAVLFLAAVLLAAAFGGPAAWPWYFCWGLVLLAAWPGVQRSTLLAVAVAVSLLLVKPDGILALPLQSAPLAVAFYALVGWAGVRRWRRHGEGTAARHDAGSSGDARTVLTGS